MTAPSRPVDLAKAPVDAAQAAWRVDGITKVTGRARYAADVQLPGCLVGRVLRSPYAHARIVGYDLDRARRVPGVRAVLTARDLPDVLIGRALRDVPVLASGRVRFMGEKVVAIAGDDADAVEEALELAQVEYEELPGVFDVDAAIAPEAEVLHPGFASYTGAPSDVLALRNVQSRLSSEKGDVELGLRTSHRVFEHGFRTPFVHHAYLEPHACVVRAGPRMVEVWASQKAPFKLRTVLAAVSGVAEEDIVIHPLAVGGDFGGKGSFMDVPVAYCLSHRTGRPVKMTMSYGEELQAANPRHASVVRVRTGVARDGTLLARDVRILYNGGAYGGFKPLRHVNLNGALQGGGSYRIPHVRIESLCVYTNVMPGGHFRAPGEAQMIFAVESATDMVARALGIDPLEFRRRNLLHADDLDPLGRHLEDLRVRDVLAAAVDGSSWHRPKPANVGRGIAVWHRKQAAGSSTASVLIGREGIRLRTTLPDTGTGLHSTLRAIVAREFEVAPGQVAVETTDTGVLPADEGVGATRVTILAGLAARAAAGEVRARFLERLARRFECRPGDVAFEDGTITHGEARLDLLDAASLVLRPGEAIEATHTMRADTSKHYTISSAQVAEVEVDPRTGQVSVRSIVSAHDVGEIFDPVLHQGQIDGGVAQGLGYALMEELTVEEGQVTTAHFGEYKVPTQLDMPPLTTILVRDSGGSGPLGSKAIGEASLSGVAPAIANAVEDAVGVRITDLPLTAEKVWTAMVEGGRRRPSGGHRPRQLKEGTRWVCR